MQTDADSMSLMTREVCRALEIDIQSLYDISDHENSDPPSAHTASDIKMEVDVGGVHSQDAIEQDSPHGLGSM